jgi:hypothetical protein
MKLFTLLSASALYASTTAWTVNFHTRSNIGWNVHGTKDVTCNTINWPSGKATEDVEYIKCVSSPPFQLFISLFLCLLLDMLHPSLGFTDIHLASTPPQTTGPTPRT